MVKKMEKGKEYDYYNGELLFEGEYLNDKKWTGNGKEYYRNNKLKFEGEYLKGKKWNGKEYDIKNNIIYQLEDGKGYITLNKKNLIKLNNIKLIKNF